MSRHRHRCRFLNFARQAVTSVTLVPRCFVLPAMPVVTLENVSLAYGHVPLLDRVELVIEPGDRLALIGRNGTGKTSLLKVLAGEVAADDGVVWRQPQLRLAHLLQEPVLDSEETVFDAAAAGLGQVRALLVEYEHAA